MDQDNIIIIEVYVNEVIFGSDNDRLSKTFTNDMHKEFQMYLLGEFNFLLGFHISQQDKGIFISQTKYIKEMINKFKMEDCKLASTPMVISCKLSKYVESLEADERLYRPMIGSLHYVTSSRPYVMQEVG